IAELEQYAPEVIEKTREALAHGDRDVGVLRLAKNYFSASPSISLDHAVMERTKRAAVVPVSCGWTDLGAWSQLHDISERDKDGNALYGEVVCDGARNCYLRGEGPLVAAVGIDDLIVVATDDVVLVTRKGCDQNVKQFVERLKQENRAAATTSRRVHRPWGFYE